MLAYHTTGLINAMESGHKLSVPFEMTEGDGFARRFETLRQLGNGATSTVVLVEDRITHLRYAAKIFRKDPSNDVINLRIEAEFTMLDRLRHPNVLNLQRVVMDSEKYYILTEWADGGDLFSHIRCHSEPGRGMSETDYAPLLYQCACALYHLHTHGVAHRDIKPQNFLMGLKNSRVLLADFGLATQIRQGIASKCGTLAFASPEILAGDYCGSEADIWALGVMTFFALTGTLPFFSLVASDVPRLISEAKLVFPPGSDLSKPARSLIRGMLNRDVVKRLSAAQIVNSEFVKEYLVENITVSSLHKSRKSKVIKSRRSSIRLSQTGLPAVISSPKMVERRDSVSEEMSLDDFSDAEDSLIPAGTIVIAGYKTQVYFVSSRLVHLTWASIKASLCRFLSTNLEMTVLVGDFRSPNSHWCKIDSLPIINNLPGLPFEAYHTHLSNSGGILNFLLEFIWNAELAKFVCTARGRILFYNRACYDLLRPATIFGGSIRRCLGENIYRLWKLDNKLQEGKMTTKIGSVQEIDIKWRRMVFSVEKTELILFRMTPTATPSKLAATRTISSNSSGLGVEQFASHSLNSSSQASRSPPAFPAADGANQEYFSQMSRQMSGLSLASSGDCEDSNLNIPHSDILIPSEMARDFMKPNPDLFNPASDGNLLEETDSKQFMKSAMHMPCIISAGGYLLAVPPASALSSTTNLHNLIPDYHKEGFQAWMERATHGLTREEIVLLNDELGLTVPHRIFVLCSDPFNNLDLRHFIVQIQTSESPETKWQVHQFLQSLYSLASDVVDTMILVDDEKNMLEVAGRPLSSTLLLTAGAQLPPVLQEFMAASPPETARLRSIMSTGSKLSASSGSIEIDKCKFEVHAMSYRLAFDHVTLISFRKL